MMQRTDVVFVPRVDVNEGLTVGQITQACLVGTPRYLFICPLQARSFIGSVTSARWRAGADDMAPAIESYLSEKVSVEKLEKELTALLSKDTSQRRVFPVDQLERFAIQVGFWIFGGMSLQLAGEGRKVINIPGKGTRQKLRDFYASRLK